MDLQHDSVKQVEEIVSSLVCLLYFTLVTTVLHLSASNVTIYSWFPQVKLLSSIANWLVIQLRTFLILSLRTSEKLH